MHRAEKNRILVVDDEKANIEILSSILSPEYTVYMTKTGFGAIELASKHSPDLILLDILMPDMDGFEVLSALKASEETQDIPIIFITGLDSVKDEERGLSLGAADFIHKPFSNSIVQSRVRNQIQLVNQIRELVKLQGDLESAVKTAETANKTKSAFLATMSHEIRTPLNAIIGISEIQLQNKALPPETREALGRIFSSGDLLLGIINDILDMSKIEAGKLELLPAKYDVASLINDTVFLNMIKYENKPIDFILDVDEQVPAALFGDELRIKQILNNLLSNAFKYTNAGEVRLSVSSEPAAAVFGDTAGETAENNVTLVFRVADTGQGMSPEQLAKLGDEYSRFNQEANRMTQGTGLGMSITQNLIRMMNSELRAESEPGKGSLFTIRLRQGNVGAPPLGKKVADQLRKFRSNYEAKSKKTEVVRGAIYHSKILVVDDMDMNLYVAKGMLAPYDLQIETATSGPEAIEKIKRNKYDLVFMDHMMPKMDGIEATQEIRKLGGKYEKLPIIALTANAVAGMKETFLSSGFNGFISKPIAVQELDKVLREWLSLEKVIHSGESDTAGEANANDAFDSFIKEVSKIEEINTEVGLSRFPGMKEIYRITVEMFYKKLLSECNNMNGFLAADDLESFAISVHAMKSSLATVGSMRLSEIAAEMETASKNRETDFCQEKFPVLREKLLALQKKLSVIFDGPKDEQEKEPGNMDSLREDTRKALAAAEAFDDDACTEIIKNLLPYDFGGENNDLLESALTALENFDYESAVGALRKIE
jgi:signal transduction histidine kinase/HPt (histidine-containing phosphotransfer) domain-containing protein